MRPQENLHHQCHWQDLHTRELAQWEIEVDGSGHRGTGQRPPTNHQDHCQGHPAGELGQRWCTEAQGFHCGEPAPEVDVGGALATETWNNFFLKEKTLTTVCELKGSWRT